MKFDIKEFHPNIEKILGQGNKLAALTENKPDQEKLALLQSINPLVDFGEMKDKQAAKVCLAALWIYHNFDDNAHEVVQDIHTSEASAWHAIIHRREPDAWNSKYWWNQVGSQNWIADVREECKNQGLVYTSPQAFVDICDKLIQKGSGVSEEEFKSAQRVQLIEWQQLFLWTYRMSF